MKVLLLLIKLKYLNLIVLHRLIWCACDSGSNSTGTTILEPFNPVSKPCLESMANPELRDAVQHVTNELQGLRSALRFDNISRAIKTFDGSQANLRNWLTEVDKFAFINGIDGNATKLIAYQSAGGKCSEFLQRGFQEYPRDSWEGKRSN